MASVIYIVAEKLFAGKPYNYLDMARFDIPSLHKLVEASARNKFGDNSQVFLGSAWLLSSENRST